jgi:serpin B
MIDLHLPKYSMDTGYDLVSACRDLGMADAFLPEHADFRGMGWSPGALWIAQITHKAFVAVNEEGTEAAAATGIGMQTKSARRYPSFRTDHPFLFLIRDDGTGSILFTGRVSHPVDQ